jgi:drug/metabolite transporter (DMT)-like permease
VERAAGRPDALAAGAVVLMGAIWGYNWVALKMITPDVSPFVLSAMRVVTATLVLFLAVLVLRRPLRSPPPWPTFIAGMLQSGIFIILQNFALLAGGVGKTAVLTYTMPFWVVIIAPFAIGERITPSRAAALVLGIAGLACVLFPLDVQHALLSKILAVATAILWAAGVLYTKHLRARYTFDTLTYTAWQMFYASPLLILAAIVMPGAAYHPGPHFWPLFVAVAVGGTAVAFLLFMFIVSRFSAGAAGLSALLVPVMTLLNAALWLGEWPTPIEEVGTAFILAGLAVNSIPQRFERALSS